MQDGHKVRICISVADPLADEVKNLGGTFGVYMNLRIRRGGKIMNKYSTLK